MEKGVVFCDGECGEDGDTRYERGDDGWAGEDSIDNEDIFSFVSIRSDGLTSETVDNSGSNGVGNNTSLLELLLNIGLAPGMSLSTPSRLESTIFFHYILSNIIQYYSVWIGCYPDKLKIARVRPLYKKGDKQGIENYRPISILPSVSKKLYTHS